MKKLIFVCMVSLSFFSACDEDEFESSNLSVNSINGEYTCEGNGTKCIARNYLLTCTNDVMTIEQSSKCADAEGEYVPPEKQPASFNCEYEGLNEPKCTCSGTGSKCQSGWSSKYYLTCSAGKMGNVKPCHNGCDDSIGCI